MISTMFLLAVVSVSWQSDGADLQAEIDRTNLESQKLAAELTELLKEIGENKVTVDEEIFADILERIQEIAEATEEDNFIRLSEAVRSKRLVEEELQLSVTDLQDFLSQLSAGEERS